MRHIDKKEYEEGLRLLELSANTGNFRAQYNLGKMYYYGIGTDKYYSTANKYFKLSTNNGSWNGRGFSYRYLGKIYEKGGYGVEKNLKISLDYYERANASGLNQQFVIERVKEKISEEEKSLKSIR